ncbi:MAG: hypothetical protein Q8O31_00185 [Rhodocyclaceae bacterium]|nr:hypothetical protein [Rhodocyclaceae bacterium]
MKWTALWLMGLSCNLLAEPAPERLGRLFFTPEERATIDRPPVEKHPSRKRSKKAVHFDGLVVRSSGHHTAWINGTPWYDGELPEGMMIDLPPENPGQATLNVEGKSSRRIGESRRR